jgi:pimeloyl-ACP methyl ester carboxylesterase
MLISGRELAVEVDVSGPPTVFLHGLGGTTNVFRIQADILAVHSRTCRAGGNAERAVMPSCPEGQRDYVR